MKRRTSTLPCRIWPFGTRPPTKNGQIVDSQLRLAHRYYNTLIEIERSRREQYRAARSSVDTELARLETERAELTQKIEAARTEIKAARQKKRGGTEVSATDKAQIARMRVERKAVGEQIKAQRLRVAEDPALVALSQQIDEAAQDRVKAARENCGVFWGSYLLIERAVEAARKSKTSDPRFKRYQGEGRIGIQLQPKPKGRGHWTIDDIFAGKSSMLQIDPLPDTQWDTRSGRRHAYTMVRIRVGSNPDRSPIWAEFPILMHRKIPAGAIVTWAWVNVYNVGTERQYRLQLTLESAEFARVPTGKGKVAIDIGWRAVAGGIRVGYAVDDQGVARELVLPLAVKERLWYCSELQEIQDRQFNLVRLVLSGYIANGGALPEWIAEQIKYLGQWKSPKKLAYVAKRWIGELVAEDKLRALWNRWRTERINGTKQDLFGPYPELVLWFERAAPGIEPMALYLEWWRQKNDHLYNWSSNQRENVLARRLDIYRNWAYQLSQRYATIVIEDFDLRTFARNAAPEQDSDADVTHRTRNTASPSQLVACLLSAAADVVVKLDPADTTRQCAQCGHVNTEWEKPEERVQTCHGCKSQWDQDYNAALNLLKRYDAAQDGGPQEPDPAPKPAKKRTSAQTSSVSSSAL